MQTMGRRATIVMAIVTVVTATAVTTAQRMVNPAGGPTISVIPMDTSEPATVAPSSRETSPLAPPPPGFPDLDSFTDVSRDHDVSRHYPLTTFTSPTGLQCAMWSSRGDTAAFCFGTIPGLDHSANQVYAGDYKAYFDLNTPPDTDKLNGRPLASGEKVVLGAEGNLIGGDQITCGAEDLLVACMVIRDFRRNHGDETAQRHGFVVSPEASWTF